MNHGTPGRMTLIATAVLAIAVLILPSGGALAKGGTKKNEIKFYLLSTGADSDASARATLKTNSNRNRFEVKLKKLPVGAYDVVVAGMMVGVVDVKPDDSGGTAGKLKIDPGKGNPLSFDPLGMPIEVTQSATVFFSDLFPTSPSDIANDDYEVDFTNTGVVPGAEGEAGFRLRNGKMEFDVEIEDVPAGDYDLRVDGVVVATITAALRSGKNSVEGEVDFSTAADGNHELPLTFDPRGKLIEVLDGGSAVILSVDFPASAPAP